MDGKRVVIIVKFETGTTNSDNDEAKRRCETILKDELGRAELAFDFDIIGTSVEDLSKRE